MCVETLRDSVIAESVYGDQAANEARPKWNVSAKACLSTLYAPYNSISRTRIIARHGGLIRDNLVRHTTVPTTPPLQHANNHPAVVKRTSSTLCVSVKAWTV